MLEFLTPAETIDYGDSLSKRLPEDKSQISAWYAENLGMPELREHLEGFISDCVELEHLEGMSFALIDNEIIEPPESRHLNVTLWIDMSAEGNIERIHTFRPIIDQFQSELKNKAIEIKTTFDIGNTKGLLRDNPDYFKQAFCEEMADPSWSAEGFSFLTLAAKTS